MNSNNILLGQFDYTDPPNQELPITPLLYSGRYKCESCQCRFVHDYQLWFHWRDHIPRHQRDYSYITSYIAFKGALKGGVGYYEMTFDEKGM